MRWTFIKAAAAALALGGFLAAPAAADASEDPHILDNVETGNGPYDCSDDVGGMCAWAQISFRYGDSAGTIRASFNPYGEILSVRDGYADGLAAKGQLRYLYRGEWVAHTVTARGNITGRNFDLAEGLGVQVRVCQESTGICTRWWSGKA